MAANLMPLVIVSQIILRFRDSLGAEWSSAIAYLVLFPLVAGLQGSVIASMGHRGVRWALVTVVALTLAMMLGMVVMATAEGHGSETLWMHGSWLVAGLVLGTGQWLELRRWLARPRWWILATAAGWVGGAAIWSGLWAWRSTLSRAIPWRALLGGLDVTGNIELSIVAVTLVIYSGATAAVLARHAAGTRPLDG
jgi:hypothetical protein